MVWVMTYLLPVIATRRHVDGKEPVCPFVGTFVMIVGALVTWAIYTQGQLLL